MYELLLILYEFLCELVPFFVAFSVYCHVLKEKGTFFSLSATLLYLVLAIYLMAVFHVTGTGTMYTAVTFGLNFDKVNLIPFSGAGFSLTGCLLNAVMFLPFGFLLPLLFPEKRKFSTVIAAGFGFSLLIELSQLLSLRTPDVDDLIMNTLGAAIGFLFYLVLAKCVNKKGKDLPKSLLPFVVFSLFFARFCLYAERIMGQLIHEFLN